MIYVGSGARVLLSMPVSGARFVVARLSGAAGRALGFGFAVAHAQMCSRFLLFIGRRFGCCEVDCRSCRQRAI